MFAREHPESKMLYLCFNRTAAKEAQARFPANVRCGTTHSLAFCQSGWQFKENPDKKIGIAPKAKAIMPALGIHGACTAGRAPGLMKILPKR